MKRYTTSTLLAFMGAGFLLVVEAQTPQQLEQARQKVIVIEQREQQQQVLHEEQEHDIAELKALLAVDPPGGGEVEIGDCGEPMDRWHGDAIDIDPGPGVIECFPGHEHGDQPPQWLINKGVQVVYGGDEATPSENELKHSAYKGFAVDELFGGQKAYVRVHAASNPHDRGAQYHSFEFYLLGPTDGLTRIQLWYNTGDYRFPGPNRRSSAAEDEGVRPTIGMVDQAGLDAGRGCEQWYMLTDGLNLDWSWAPEFGWNICGATIRATPNEHLTAHDYSVWLPLAIEGAGFGSQRRLDISFYKFDGFPRDSRAPMGVAFWSTQFAEIVTGSTDPLCGTTVTVNERTYTRKCLEQYIDPDYVNIGFSTGNAFQKVFSVRNVRLPN